MLRSRAKRGVSKHGRVHCPRLGPWFETPAFGGLLTMRFGSYPFAAFCSPLAATSAARASVLA